MKILQVTIYGERKFGGPPQKIFALSEGLAARGHEVDIASFHSDAPGGRPSESIGGARLHFLKWVGRELLQLPTDWRRLRRLIQRADVVHLYGLYNLLCPLAALWAWRLGKPFVLEPVGMWVPRARNLRFKAIYNRLLTLPMARGAARVVATSPREREELAGFVPEDKLVLRRNGLDLSAFAHLPPADALRALWGLGDGERVVLFIGRISPIKNLDTLIRAFAAARVPGARLVLVGPELEPDYAATLRALVDELGLLERVLLAGELYGDDKLAALGAAELFVLPSTYESYGNAAAEAVAAGVPVLLSNGCGIAPLLHERAGMAVAPEIGPLAAGLTLLLTDPAARADLMRRRAEVVRDLSWDEPLDQTEALYAALLQK